MDLPKVVSRDEWLAARTELLAREKELTRARDALAAERRRLPMVEIVKQYEFTGPHGAAGLLDLFEGRRQLMIYHFMWRPDVDLGCPSCSGFADQIARGHLAHLHLRNTTLAFVSRGAFDRIEAFRARMGWTVPWYSSHGSDFNYDFHVTLDESVAPIEYNYRTRAEWRRHGLSFDDWEQPFDLHGLSCFVRDSDRVFHTYSAYGRGTEMVGGMHYFLDLTALGRQEDWEEPKGRSAGAPKAGDPLRYPDEYELTGR